MEKKHYAMFCASLVLLTFGFFVIASTPYGVDNSVGEATTINYEANVCVTHERDGEVLNEECSHNVLYNTGMDLVRDYLGDTGGGADEIDQISLCNGSSCGTPVAGKTENWQGYPAICGMDNATGTYDELVGLGNWSIYNTFTSTCDDILVNASRLGNTAGIDFAGNTFSLVTLQTDDQLTINWTIRVS